jgi:hypothetical protein
MEILGSADQGSSEPRRNTSKGFFESSRSGYKAELYATEASISNEEAAYTAYDGARRASVSTRLSQV